MRLPRKTLEKKLFNNGYRNIIAVDEVGMGCLAGPVVVCAVLFNKKFFEKSHKRLHWLRDSKLLLARKREEFMRELIKIPEIKFQISYCFPKTIDRLNIYQAARKAMRRAVKKLAMGIFASDAKMPIVLVDGPRKIVGLPLEQVPIIKGDRKIFAIACASIIAKVYRDKMMTRYAKHYPGYGFEKHKGYCTKYHRVQLVSFGPCEIHRKSFRLQY